MENRQQQESIDKRNAAVMDLEARYRAAIHALEDAAIAMARSANTGAIYPQELKRAIQAAQDAIDKAPAWVRSRG